MQLLMECKADAHNVSAVYRRMQPGRASFELLIHMPEVLFPNVQEHYAGAVRNVLDLEIAKLRTDFELLLNAFELCVGQIHKPCSISDVGHDVLPYRDWEIRGRQIKIPAFGDHENIFLQVPTEATDADVVHAAMARLRQAHIEDIQEWAVCILQDLLWSWMPPGAPPPSKESCQMLLGIEHK